MIFTKTNNPKILKHKIHAFLYIHFCKVGCKQQASHQYAGRNRHNVFYKKKKNNLMYNMPN